MQCLRFPNSDLLMISWKDFQDAFYEKYFPDHVRDRLDRVFRGLQQGSMTVAEYKATFARLERFAQTFDSEERRAKRFLEGLQPGLKMKVMACQCQILQEMVDMASRFKDEYKS